MWSYNFWADLYIVLGTTIASIFSYFILIISDELITSVAVGLHHTVFGTKSGIVYCCGDSSQGQCGTLEQAHYNTPICVATFSSPVKKVSVYELLIYLRLLTFKMSKERNASLHT